MQFSFSNTLNFKMSLSLLTYPVASFSLVTYLLSPIKFCSSVSFSFYTTLYKLDTVLFSVQSSITAKTLFKYDDDKMKKIQIKKISCAISTEL